MPGPVKRKTATPLWVIQLRKHLPAAAAITVILVLYLGGILEQVFVSLGMDMKVRINPISALLANFRYGFSGAVTVLLVTVSIALLIILAYSKSQQGGNMDSRGFKLEDVGTYGTASLMDVERAREYVEVEPLEKTEGFIIGKFIDSRDPDGLNQVVSIPRDGKRFSYDRFGRPIMEQGPDGKKHQKREKLSFNGNRHMMVIGPSGSGKSYTFVRTNIFQSILQGESIIVTDPKGEMYADTSEFAKEHGYVVRIFNLFWPPGSDAVHFLAQLKGDQIGIEAQSFANIVIANTENPGGGGDAAYSNGEKNLLTALVLFVLTAPNCDRTKYARTFGGVYKLLCEPLEEIEALFEELETLDPNNPALGPWSIFKDGSEAFRGNLRTGLGNRLTVLNDSVIKNITGGDERGENDEIDLTMPGTTKCAYYVIMDDMEDTFKFLSSLFFTYLINGLVKFSRQQMTGRLPVNVNIIMDEFIAIGRLPDFEKKLATVRSAGISISMIFQNKPQLDAAYPNGLSDTIIGNCSTILCLACNDMVTAKFLSDRSGVATIALDNTHVEEAVIGLTPPSNSVGHSYSQGRRNLLNLDEITRLDPSKVLVVITSADVFMADKFPYTDIVDPTKLKTVNIYNHVPSWRQKEVFKTKPDEPDEEDEGYTGDSEGGSANDAYAGLLPGSRTSLQKNPQAKPAQPPQRFQQNRQNQNRTPAPNSGPRPSANLEKAVGGGADNVIPFGGQVQIPAPDLQQAQAASWQQPQGVTAQQSPLPAYAAPAAGQRSVTVQSSDGRRITLDSPSVPAGGKARPDNRSTNPRSAPQSQQKAQVQAAARQTPAQPGQTSAPAAGQEAKPPQPAGAAQRPRKPGEGDIARTQNQQKSKAADDRKKQQKAAGSRAGGGGRRF